MAASMAATEIMYFRGLLSELGHDLEPTVLYVDNQGAVELSKDAKSCHRSRHVLRRFFKVRELVHSGEIAVKWIDTNANKADLLTKSSFSPATFDKLKAMSMSAKDISHVSFTGLPGLKPPKKSVRFDASVVGGEPKPRPLSRRARLRAASAPTAAH